MQNFRLRTTERRRFYHIKQGLHSHIPFCIKNYVLTCIIITLGPQSCFGNFTAAGRDISSPAQHPSPAMPRAISSATAKKLIPHLVNVPVTAPRVLAAKAIWCTTLSTPPTKKKKKCKEGLWLQHDMERSCYHHSQRIITMDFFL